MRLRAAAVWFELLFLATYLYVDFQAGLPWTQRTVSDLVYGPHAAVLLVSFFLHAASLGTLAITRPRAKIPLLVGTLGMIIVAVFWADPRGVDSWVGTIHIVGAVMAFGGVAVAAWLERRELPLVPLSLMVVLMTMIMAAATQERFLAPLFERFQVFVNAAWIINAALARRS